MRFHHGGFPGEWFFNVFGVEEDYIHNVVANVAFTFNLKVNNNAGDNANGSEQDVVFLQTKDIQLHNRMITRGGGYANLHTLNTRISKFY